MTKPQDLDDEASADDEDQNPLKQKFPGMLIPIVRTQNGSVIVSY